MPNVLGLSLHAYHRIERSRDHRRARTTGAGLGLVWGTRLPACDGQHRQDDEQRRRIKEQAAWTYDSHRRSPNEGARGCPDPVE